MNARSQSKSALITGSSKRIGESISRKLANMGYKIALHYQRSKKEVNALAKDLTEQGCHVKTYCYDLTDPKNAERMINGVIKDFPDLSVLINNASIFNKDDFKTVKIKQMEQNLNIHLKSPFVLMQNFANKCKKGNIINILDTHVLNQESKHFAYLLSKKALSDLTQMAAVELAPHIRVNGIAPGLILPPENQGDAYLKRLAKDIPLKKKGSVEHITHTVEFLLTNTYLTGQIIFNDGGEHLL